MNRVRLRFAPSPTGQLHIGGARTAFFNWLVARQRDGALVLRIEDTDRERYFPEHVEQILDSLSWLGIDFDEGPFSQHDRIDGHRSAIDRLLERDLAYRSAATSEDVRLFKRDHSGAGYRGRPSSDGQGAVRLRVPDAGRTEWQDIVRGPIAFDNATIDDFVIARSDGTPLYNVAVAVDDLEMGITHVVRGEDHISNTPKQLLVAAALGGEPPLYAHLPLLHGPDGKKLSKRHGATSVDELRDMGFLPRTVCNYLALLGWSFDDRTTFFSTRELVERFSLERVQRSPAIFDYAKLRSINAHYLRDLTPAELRDALAAHLRFAGKSLPGDRLEGAAEITKEKISTLDEFWPLAGFLFERPVLDERAWSKVMSKEGSLEALRMARESLADLSSFDASSVERAMRGAVDRLEAKPGAVFQPVRVAICGKTVSPGLFESLSLLGRQESLARIDRARSLLEVSSKS